MATRRQTTPSLGTDSGPPQRRNFVAIANRYAREAAADKKGKKFCRFVRLAAKRHLDDLKKANWDFKFDPWHGEDVCDFIEKLPHVEGKWDGPTIHLEAPQIFILVVIFGWRRKADGKRRFTTSYIEMARKGAKSTLTAGISLYCLTCEDEVGPQIIIGATTGEQAGKVFNPAKQMVRKTQDLREAFGVAAWSRSITCSVNNGFIQPINAKGKTQDGWNPHVGILDELHAHKDRALFDVIRSSDGSRSNPLFWYITTAGYDMSGVCYAERTFVIKVLEGLLSADHYFGIIFTLDEGDDAYDEKKWIKANPMLGVTPSLRSMRSYAAEAKGSPASEGEFKTKRLNIWLNAASNWLSSAAWLACGDQTLEWSDFEGLTCYIGGDLADKDDITALALVALDTVGRLLIKPKFYLPKAVLEEKNAGPRKFLIPQYRAWENAGHLTLTEGDWVDQGIVKAQIKSWLDTLTVHKVIFDQFSAAQEMASQLNAEYQDKDGGPIAAVLHKKAANVTDPAKELEARVKAGPAKLRHDANPVLAWMASNCVVSRRTDGTILPKKESEMSPNKIDGIDAVINGMQPATLVVPPGGYFEEHGLLVL